MTLEQLAADAGLTRSYLSKIERGLSTPSIESALKIASALNVTVEKLFGKESEPIPISIVRASESDEQSTAHHLSLIAGASAGQLMRAFIVRPGKKASRGRIMSHHEGEELLYVISGEIEFHVESRREVLHPGDCVHFNSTSPHKLVALTDSPASVLVVVVNAERK
jgi:transcriptional regulator with XRE-family HTH domain